MTIEITSAPSLDINDELFTKHGRAVPPARRLEQHIVWNLIAHLGGLGFALLGVDDGDQYRPTVSSRAALELVFNLDESRLVFEEPGRAKHSVLLVAGNGEDIISDWSYSPGDWDGFCAAVDAFLLRLDEVARRGSW